MNLAIKSCENCDERKDLITKKIPRRKMRWGGCQKVSNGCAVSPWVLGCSPGSLGPKPVQICSEADGTRAPHLALTSAVFLQDLSSQYFPGLCVSQLNTELAHHGCLDRSSWFWSLCWCRQELMGTKLHWHFSKHLPNMNRILGSF